MEFGAFKKIIYILFCIFLVLSLLTLIFNILIIHKSKGNTLNSELEDDKYRYFIYKPKKFIYCFCEGKNFTGYCTRNLLEIGCEDAFLDDPIMVTNEYDCIILQYKIMNKNISLNKIFNLNTKSYRGATIALLVIKLITLIISICKFACQRELLKDDGDTDFCMCAHIMSIILFVFLIIEIILFSISCSRYNDDDAKK